jgi:hypothetical protein
MKIVDRWRKKNRRRRTVFSFFFFFDLLLFHSPLSFARERERARLGRCHLPAAFSCSALLPSRREKLDS